MATKKSIREMNGIVQITVEEARKAGLKTGADLLSIEVAEAWTWAKNRLLGDDEETLLLAKRINERPFTEAGSAEALEILFANTLRYNTTRGVWLVWDGNYWAEDKHRSISKLVTLGLRIQAAFAIIYAEEDGRNVVEITKWVAGNESAYRIKAVTSLLADRLSICEVDCNNDPWLLAAEDGTIDLRTGEIRK